MGIDPNATSFVAALFTSPSLNRLITTKDRSRHRFFGCRAHLLDSAKWIRKLEAVQKPVVLWNEDETNKSTTPTTGNCFRCGIQPLVTGIVLSGLAAFLLHLSGALDTLKLFAAAPPNEVEQLARFRGMPTIEEEMKETIKGLESGVDSLIENVSPEDATLTKEEVSKQQALIREVWETVWTSYYNERDPTFSKENWTRIRDEALRQKPKSKASVYRTIRGMISKGLKDPYAKLISPEEFRVMQKYDMTGVGLNIGSSEEFNQKVSSKIPGEKKRNGGGILVMGLLKGSASERAGLQQGDQILEVDGIPLNGSTPYEAAQLIKGNSSSEPVTLKVLVKDGSLKDVQMNRQSSRVTPVVKTSVERVRLRRVGRISVSGCNSEARQDILKGLKVLEAQKIKEVILDLRGNPGGLVEEAAEIAKLFLNEGTTVYIKRDGSDARQTKVTSHQRPQTQMRLIVQVDEKTASAAEIIAGALQDNCRAVIAGDRTYGKGLIQSVFQLSDGAGLTMTVGKYYTPRMRDIDQTGIVPDFRKIPASAQADEVLNTCRVRQQKPSK